MSAALSFTTQQGLVAPVSLGSVVDDNRAPHAYRPIRQWRAASHALAANKTDAPLRSSHYDQHIVHQPAKHLTAHLPPT